MSGHEQALEAAARAITKRRYSDIRTGTILGRPTNKQCEKWADEYWQEQLPDATVGVTAFLSAQDLGEYEVLVEHLRAPLRADHVDERKAADTIETLVAGQGMLQKQYNELLEKFKTEALPWKQRAEATEQERDALQEQLRKLENAAQLQGVKDGKEIERLKAALKEKQG